MVFIHTLDKNVRTVWCSYPCLHVDYSSVQVGPPTREAYVGRTLRTACMFRGMEALWHQSQEPCAWADCYALHMCKINILFLYDKNKKTKLFRKKYNNGRKGNSPRVHLIHVYFTWCVKHLFNIKKKKLPQAAQPWSEEQSPREYQSCRSGRVVNYAHVSFLLQEKKKRTTSTWPKIKPLHR